MAPSKNTPKPKGMFKPYDELDVPDIMPLPELALIATTKGEATAVPKLNEYQRSWILDVGVRGVDLPSLAGKAASEFYDKVKQDAFEAKAFQHTTRVQDRVEEAGLPALVAAWKQQHPAKNKNAKDEDDNASEEEEDEGGRVALLRGYTKAGWRIAIQKVISNKRTAERTKRKARNNDAPNHADTGESIRESPALAKLLGLAAYTGRDKFRDDRHDEIHEYSKTLKGTSNAGGKFRKAEAEMWAKENQASWEDAAAADEDVDWVERQKLVASGFRQMVQTLHATRKFRPFVATMLMAWMNDEGHVQFEWQVVEAVPDDIRMPQAFEKQYKELVKESVDAMHDWAENPLKEHLATRADSAKRAPPVFPLTAEALGDVSPKKLAETVTTFLAESYEVAFGSQDIPWAAISSAPTDYYDAALPVTSALPFASTGLTGLSLVQWFLPQAARSPASPIHTASSSPFAFAGQSSAWPIPTTSSPFACAGQSPVSHIHTSSSSFACAGQSHVSPIHTSSSPFACAGQSLISPIHTSSSSPFAFAGQFYGSLIHTASSAPSAPCSGG
ncbi:hypothetical protein DFH09DRAFT_1327727 [Mycena vulgaris]|nr:hypothetical protein DFH09DRAFT_1327727 [Mycena vulgaris]